MLDKGSGAELSSVNSSYPSVKQDLNTFSIRYQSPRRDFQQALDLFKKSENALHATLHLIRHCDPVLAGIICPLNAAGSAGHLN